MTDYNKTEYIGLIMKHLKAKVVDVGSGTLPWLKKQPTEWLKWYYENRVKND